MIARDLLVTRPAPHPTAVQKIAAANSLSSAVHSSLSSYSSFSHPSSGLD